MSEHGVQSVTLHQGWRLTRADDRDVDARAIDVPAVVPGCVHTDLMRAGAIDDPFLDDNELAVAWVADADWRYTTSFSVPRSMTGAAKLELVAEGLDTLATVELDGVVVALTENMHRRYRIDLTAPLIGPLADASSVHTLSITFASATREAERRRRADDRWPSSSFGRPFNHIRKMACSWGWDWGPWLTTAGIWRPLRLEATPFARLTSVRPRVAVGDAARGTVTVAVDVDDVRVDALGSLSIETTIRDSADTCIAVASGPVSRALVIDAGTVELWWPRGQGGQPLYELETRLVDERGTELDCMKQRIGFRSVELRTTPDALGAEFTIAVNDRPMFARGVNWIPDDPFVTRIDAARYRRRLQQAVDANVDLVRVWGGGIYESDAFYDACDELGLLVWQDCCFACAAYPEDSLDDEVLAEVADNAERLMPHPSLAVWNGNNENIWGYVDWHWQQRLDGAAWGSGWYLDRLPATIARVDPDRPYWPGSPYSGSMTVAPNADAHGCTHVWDVWNQLDLDRYRDHAPRFVSEFGWQAPPTLATVRAAISDAPLLPDSPGMAHHQKADQGDVKLTRGLVAHMPRPDPGAGGFDDWLWATQLVQARAVTVGIEHFRSLRPFCMGTIWWQLNDCWPVTSWAVVDGGERRKPSWYAMRAAYRDRLLTVQPRGQHLALIAVNDSDRPWVVTGSITRRSFSGDVLAEQSVDVHLDGRSSTMLVLAAAVAAADDPRAELIVVDAGGDRTLWFFVPDHQLSYTQPELQIGVHRTSETEQVVDVTSANLVRDLSMLADRIHSDAWTDRQLLTLLPGQRASWRVVDAPDLSDGPLLRDSLWSANRLAR